MHKLSVEPSTNKYHSCLACHNNNEDSRYYQITIGDIQLEMCEVCDVCVVLFTYDLFSIMNKQKRFV